MEELFGKDLKKTMNKWIGAYMETPNIKKLEEAIEKQKAKPMGYVPPEGYVWNPLRAYPRNLFCPCTSGKKFKKCCLPKMPATVKAEDEKMLKEAVQKALKIHNKN